MRKVLAIALVLVSGCVPLDTRSSSVGEVAMLGSNCRSRGSACGCTKYRKATCNHDECCSWVKGLGCRCR